MTWIRRYYLLLAVFITTCVLATVGYAQEQYVFWIGATDTEETRGNVVFRLSVAGGEIDTLVQAKKLSPNMARFFYFIAVDSINGRIYWTDSGGEDSTGAIDIGAITRMRLDGTNPETFVGGIVCGVGAPQGLVIDADRDSLYWGISSECSGSALNRIGLFDTDPTEWELLPTNGHNDVVSIDLDVVNQMVYWSNFDWQDPPRSSLGIRRAPVNSTISDEVIVPGIIADLALSQTLSKIYWITSTDNIIRRANLDGSAVEEVIISSGDPSHLAIDDKALKIYWTEKTAGRIMRADLDGTIPEELLSDLIAPTSLALNFGSSVSVGIGTTVNIPKGVTLRGVYPNPVRESSTLEFALIKTAHVNIEVYDLLGRKVETIVSRMYPLGSYRVRWNPSDLANGVYLYKIVSGDYSEAVPFVLGR